MIFNFTAHLLVQSKVGDLLDGAKIDLSGHCSQVQDFKRNSCFVFFTRRGKVLVLLPDNLTSVCITKDHPVSAIEHGNLIHGKAIFNCYRFSIQTTYIWNPFNIRCVVSLSSLPISIEFGIIRGATTEKFGDNWKCVPDQNKRSAVWYSKPLDCQTPAWKCHTNHTHTHKTQSVLFHSCFDNRISLGLCYLTMLRADSVPVSSVTVMVMCGSKE